MENFSFTRGCGCLALTICAPKHKYLCLKGAFKDITLVDMPLFVEIPVSMYMPNDPVRHVEPSANCNFVKFLGGVPNLFFKLIHRRFAYSFTIIVINKLMVFFYDAWLTRFYFFIFARS